MNDFVATVQALHDEEDYFRSDRPVFIARSPGRLDLMGGNDDYTGGMVFESTIREATWSAAQLRDDSKILLINPQLAEQGWDWEVTYTLDDLVSEDHVRSLVNSDPKKRWTAYVLGVFYYFHAKQPGLLKRGVTVYIESDVPLNKGVSSSAAIEVAVMKSVAHTLGRPMEGIELAEACQWVENVIAESACGIMDQIAVVLGDTGAVLPLVCQPCVPQPLVRLSDELAVWAVDSGVSHAVTGIEYEAARAAGYMGYKLICDWEGIEVHQDASSRIPRYTDSRFHGYLANLSVSLFREKFEKRLPITITGAEYLAMGEEHVDPFTKARPEVAYHVRACTRYAVEENYRVNLFAALARGAKGLHLDETLILMGELMYQSHYAYTETGLGNEATDLLVELARNEGPRHGIFGAKVTGGGAGGTVAILGRADADDAFQRIVKAYAEKRGIEPYVFHGSSPGADKFGIVEVN
ncbi:galactokinase [bacterium]|nr:galactokinase [bacterium]